MEKSHITSIVWKESSGYVSKCPELNVASCGDTIEDAIKNLKEAIELYLENAKKLGILDDYKDAISTEEKFTSSLWVSLR